MKDLVDKLVNAVSAGAITEAESVEIVGKVNYAEEIRRALYKLDPHVPDSRGVQIRSFTISQRKRDLKTFLVVKATIHKQKAKPRDVVGFNTSDDLANCLYEFSQRLEADTVKWRDDVPYVPENPHDAPEKLPKWGDEDGA